MDRDALSFETKPNNCIKLSCIFVGWRVYHPPPINFATLLYPALLCFQGFYRLEEFF